MPKGEKKTNIFGGILEQLSSPLMIHYVLFIFLFDTIADVPIPPTPALPHFSQPLLALPSGHHHTIVCVSVAHVYSFFG